MQIYGASQLHGAQSINGPHAKSAPQKSTRSQSTAGGDQLELSEAGKAAARIGDIPDIRSDLVNRVRSEIASGTYDTAEKFDTAVDRLLDEIG